jgi:scyllo-inositol 2-dehydrogenase (NADP+)
MKKIPFGICGLGRIGAQHLRHFTKASDQYELVALCDIAAERVEALSAQHGCAGYTGYGDFLRHPGLELVIIANRSLDHARSAEEALAAGRTVLLEKPIGVTAADHVLLRELVARFPGRLFFCHNHRFEPAFANMRAIAESGILGRIQVVKISKHHGFWRRSDWQMSLACGGGQLSVWGPHIIDQGLQFLGSPVRQVEGHLRRVLTPGDADDHVRIVLAGDDGPLVELEISNAMAEIGPYCTIIGDRGVLTCDQEQKRIRLRYLDPAFVWDEATVNTGTPGIDYGPSASAPLPWIEETRPVTPAVDMWEYVEEAMVGHLHAALRGGVPFPVTSAQALEVVRITEIVKAQNPQFAWLS